MLDYFLVFLSSVYQIAVILFVLKEFGLIMPKKQQTEVVTNSDGSQTVANNNAPANPLEGLFKSLGPMMSQMQEQMNTSQNTKPSNVVATD